MSASRRNREAAKVAKNRREERITTSFSQLRVSFVLLALVCTASKREQRSMRREEFWTAASKAHRLSNVSPDQARRLREPGRLSDQAARPSRDIDAGSGTVTLGRPIEASASVRLGPSGLPTPACQLLASKPRSFTYTVPL